MSEQEIFVEAMNRPDPADRRRFLDEACAGNEVLRERIETLIRQSDQLGSFLEKSPQPRVTADISGAERSGTQIGPYKLIEQIGEGGMGSVWMAQQSDPVKRLVALKVIKPGMDSRQVIARFEAERQALALMDHPNIARVLDGGTTSAGRPYFVMDLVRGTPITQYCDEHHLTPKQRLELFIPVCQAVQHAHQKGIIHRDLKPFNVLVALYDGRPVPKVIDFGVAKAAGQPLTEQTLVTGFGNIVGTLEYMSPEQAEVNQLDIDTRSDIYSLGVLLYELLAGSPPFTRKELEQAGMLELLRVIREQEPSKPSTKLSSSNSLPTLSANRGTEPAKLTKLVRGELDWIVMKALEKDRNRRYETANGFAADLQRYLNDEQVQACPPSTGYRFRKFARRNRVALTTALVLAITLALATAVSTSQAIRATRAQHDADEQRTAAEYERQQAENAKKEAVVNLQKARKAVDLMLTRVAEQGLNDQPGMERVKRKLLEDALSFYQGFLQQNSTDPSIRAEAGMAYFRVGEIMRYLHGDLARAKDPFAQAISLLEQAVADFPDIPEYRLHLGRSYNGLGSCLRDAGRPEEAEQEIRHALDQFEQLERLPLSPQEDRSRRQELAWTSLCFGSLLAKSNRAEQAEQAFRKTITLCEELDAEFPNDSFYIAWIGNAYLHLTTLMAANGETEKAEKIYNKLCELSPTSALSQGTLASLLADWKEPKRRNPGRAVQLARKAVELEPTNGRYRNTLGVALYRLGEWKDAIDALKKSDQQLKGDLFSFNAFFLAMAHWQLGEHDQARTWYDKAVAWMDKNQPNNRQLLRFRAEADEVMKKETGDREQEGRKKTTPDS